MATHRNFNTQSAVIDIPDVYEQDEKPTTQESFNSEIPSYGVNVPSLFEIVKPSEVWQAGKVHANKALNLYANIDILRPYFNVEPDEVCQRILQSLIPKPPLTYKTMPLPAELYGPFMLVLTQIALLLYGMKSSNHVVKEGTLMGTAFGVSFGYWIGATSIAFAINFLYNIGLTFLQLLSLVGYSLSGHCIILFLGTIFHPVHSHLYFYFLWLIFGGLTAAKMVSVLYSKTSGHVPQLSICSVVAILHLLSILYLHFAYHMTVEALNF